MSTPPQLDSRLSRLLAAACVWTAQRPVGVLAVWALTLGISIWLSYTRLHYRTQRDDLMSADKACQVRWRAYLEEFGADDDIVFVVEGADANRLEQAADALAGELSALPTRFDRIFHRVDLRSLSDRGLLYLSVPEIKAIEARLDDLSPLLGPGATIAWKNLTLRTLVARAEGILAAQKRFGTLDDRDRDFLRQFVAILASANRVLRDPDDFVSPRSPITTPQRSDGDVLARPRYFFSDDRTLVFLLARPANPNRQSFTPAAEAVESAREIVARVSGHFPELRFGMTGLPVLENDEMAGTDRDSIRAAWLALSAIAFLYLFVYRGLRCPLLTIGSLATGTIWALGLTACTIGHLNILSSAFAVMLIGMGDYGVLWVARFDEERKIGRSFEEAMRHTAAHAGPSIVTAALSTSLAFYATMLADFQAVAELGFIAGSGVLLCAMACLTFVPAAQGLLNRWSPVKGPAAPIAISIFGDPTRSWIPSLARHPSRVIGVAAAIVVIAAVLATGVRYEDNLLHLQSPELESTRWEVKLLERTRGVGWSVLSIADTPQEAIALRRRYEQLDEIGRVEEIASLLPMDQPLKLPLLERITERLKHMPSRDPALSDCAPELTVLKESIDRIQQVPIGEPELLLTVRSFRRALDESPDAAGRLELFNKRLRASIWDDLNQLRQSSSPRQIIQHDLPLNLRERFVGASGKWLVRAYAREDVWDTKAMGRLVASARTVDPEATGKPFGTFEGLRSLKRGFLWAGLYALLAIVAVLVIDFRNVRDVLLGLLPLGLGLVVSLAILYLCNVPFNPANLVALPLIVGVGVDNGVHVLHDYRSRHHAMPYRMNAATGRGILVAALTTILGFSTLMISPHQGMQSLGFVLALGVTGCMIAALLVLPAMLCLFDRFHGRREQHAKAPKLLEST